MLTTNALLQNRYLIRRPIGRGGMGAVYEATDTRLHATVALKETLLTDAMSRRAFEREAQLLARLRHSALPKVIDHFVESDGQFLVMEFIGGDDLATLMEKRGGTFPAPAIQPWVLRWADQLLDALDYLHKQTPPVIHRDIKPQNLKLSPRGDVILLDFGLAKGGIAGMSTMAGSSTSDHMLGFTPNYAPLEQIRGGEPDLRSDLYSLAATLYHLLTGAKPPDALTRVASLLNDQEDPLRPAHEHNSYVLPAVSEALYRAMSPNMDERPQSASAMRKELYDARTPPEPVRDDQSQPAQQVMIHAQMVTLQAAAQSDGQPPAEGAARAPETTALSETDEFEEDEPEPAEVGTLIKTLHTGSPIQCLAISPDGKYIAIGCDTNVELWRLRSGSLEQSFVGHTESVSSVAFSPDGRWLVSGSEDRTLRLWECDASGDTAADNVHQTIELQDTIECVTFSPDGQWVACGGWGEAILLYTLHDGALVAAHELPAGFIHTLAFHPDSALLAGGGYDTSVHVWTVADANTEHTLQGHTNFVLTAAFNASGKVLASGGGETRIYLWRVKDGRLLDTLKGHSNFVRSLAFSSDGATLASGSEDQTVILWRVTDGVVLHRLEGHNDGVTCVAFTPDGRYLVSGSRDTKLRIWQAG